MIIVKTGGVGKSEVNDENVRGLCIYIIYTSKYNVANFIGNITMDVAKAIVTIFVTKIVVATTSAFATAVFGTVILSVSVGIVLVVTLGFAITTAIFLLDKKLKLSEMLIEHIRKDLESHERDESCLSCLST